MTEKQIRLRRKPFLMLSVFLFLLCLVGLLAFFRSEPLGDRRAGDMPAILFSAAIAIPVAFVVCGVGQVAWALWVGDFGVGDFVWPAIFLVLIGLYFLACAYIPKVAGTVELSLIAFCLVCWLCDIAWRIAKRVKRRHRRVALDSSVWK